MISTINTFCRLRDLIFVEEAGKTERGEQQLRFLDFRNQVRIYTIEEIKRAVEKKENPSG